MSITDAWLALLGILIPVLTTVFVWQLVAWWQDMAADAESAEADLESVWHLDWSFWREQAGANSPILRMTAQQMLAYLQATRNERLSA